MIRIDVHPTGENPINMTHTLPAPVHVRMLYASCGQSPYVATFHDSSTDLDGSQCSWEKSSRHNPQHAGWPIRGFVLSFSPKPTNEVVGLTQASIDDKLLGLLGLYHQYTIGTFNTYSRGSTHRSLTDTCRGYSLEGADFSHTTPWPS
jgi:hypothetical protein